MNNLIDSGTDILIIGSGMAALYSAVSASEKNKDLKITVLSPGPMGSGGCSKKTHGINAATSRSDSWSLHVSDTMKGGGYINDRKLVEVLCAGVPDRIKELTDWGMPFSKDSSNNSEYDLGNTDSTAFSLGNYGGSSIGRSHHYFDMTGMNVIHTLSNKAVLNGVTSLEGKWFISLIAENNVCYGVLVLDKDTNQIEAHYAKSTILATGGGACVYPISTISKDKLASGITAAFEAGAKLVDMEMVQFHPTGLSQPGMPGHGEIIEEEVRIQGGALLNRFGERYMYKYDERGECATRDIVARSSFIEIQKGNGTTPQSVLLDISGLNKDKFINRFPLMTHRLRAHGVDLATSNKIEISPASHYLMGGILINTRSESTISNLFVCGEDAGGIDGANRLGGNGVAGTLVFGYLAGKSAAENALLKKAFKRNAGEVKIPYYEVDPSKIGFIDKLLKDIMWEYFGLVRSRAEMALGVLKLSDLESTFELKKKYLTPTTSAQVGPMFVDGRILYQKLLLSKMIAESAIARESSVGAHFLTDSLSEESRYNVFLLKNENLDLIVERVKQPLAYTR